MIELLSVVDVGLGKIDAITPRRGKVDDIAIVRLDSLTRMGGRIGVAGVDL